MTTPLKPQQPPDDNISKVSSELEITIETFLRGSAANEMKADHEKCNRKCKFKLNVTSFYVKRKWLEMTLLDVKV